MAPRYSFNFHLILYMIMAIVIFEMSSSVSFPHEPQSLNLTDRITIDEVNHILDVDQPKSENNDTFYFGFDLRGIPQEDAKQYLPFLRYLNRSTGYNFKLRFSSKHSNVSQDLGAGKTDFAAVGAVSFIQANLKYGVKSLVRGINRFGRSEYQSIIVTAPDSVIQSLSDLKGKHFAFGALSSTQGHLIPRIILAENNIFLGDLASHEYTGSHQNCVNAILDRRLDACGMQDTMAKRLSEDGRVRILHVSGFYPSSGIAANRGVSQDVLDTVTQALLDFDPAGDHASGLYNWDQTEMPNGFEIAEQSDYLELKSWLEKLGLLNNKNAQKRVEPHL